MKTKAILAALFLGLLVGCKTTVPASYLQADRMTKASVEPMLQMTAQDHPDLKGSIDDVMTSWELRLRSAEKVADDDTDQTEQK